MSDQQGEVSEVSGLAPDSAPNLGDVSPDAEDVDHVAQGHPKNYSGERPQADDPLRTGAEDDPDQDPPTNRDVS